MLSPELIPADEAQRLAALHATGALGTPSAPALDALVQLASRALGAPTAAVNLVAEDRQWTKAAVGMAHGDEAPRGGSFCARAIVEPSGVLVVPDATQDARFAGTAMVADGLRFYAGAVVRSREGQPLGTLCVADDTVREAGLDADGMAMLEVFADAVAAHLEVVRRAKEAEASAAQIRLILADREEELGVVKTLSAIQARLARGSDATAIWDDLCVAAVELCAGTAAAIFVADGEGGALVAQAAAGFAPVGGVATLAAPSRVLQAHQSGMTDVISDLRAANGFGAEAVHHAGARSAVAMPIQEGGRSLGVLVVFFARAGAALGRREEGLLELLVSEAAVACERLRLVDRLRDLSHTDQLTGAVNRRGLELDLHREAARAGRTGRPLTLAIVDLDHFKAYNDTHGHPAGDRLLHEAVRDWRGVLRQTDTLARYGGEEFAVLLPDCGAEAAFDLLDRLRKATPRGQTCSAGVAQWHPLETVATTLERADKALYAAKAGGRDTVRVAA